MCWSARAWPSPQLRHGVYFDRFYSDPDHSPYTPDCFWILCRHVHPVLTVSGPEQYPACVEWTVGSAGRSVGQAGQVGRVIVRAAVIAVLAGPLPGCVSQGQDSGDAAPQELSIGYVAAGNLEELRRTLTTEPLVYTRSDGEYEPGLAED